MPTIPSAAPMASSWASVRLRLEGASAWTPECEAISGPSSWRATSQKPASLRWLRSTAMPSSAQRRTSAVPAGVRPGPVSGEDGNANGTPWAKAFGRLHTGPSERRPAACQKSSASRPGSIASAPSRCMTAARTPASRAASRSPGARASRRCPSRSSASSRPAARVASGAATSWPIGSASGRLNAPSPGSGTRSSSPGVGGEMGEMAPAKPPARARSRSRCPPGRPVTKPSASSRVIVSLWPSKTGITGARLRDLALASLLHAARGRRQTRGLVRGGQRLLALIQRLGALVERLEAVPPGLRLGGLLALLRGRLGLLLALALGLRGAVALGGGGLLGLLALARGAPLGLRALGGGLLLARLVGLARLLAALGRLLTQLGGALALAGRVAAAGAVLLEGIVGQGRAGALAGRGVGTVDGDLDTG